MSGFICSSKLWLALMAMGLAAHIGSSVDGGGRRFTTVELTSGKKIRGEFIHQYSQAHWAHPTQERTIALFQPQGFSADFADRSLQFVSTLEVQSIQPPSGMPWRGFRRFLRSKNVILEQAPLAGISYVLTHNGDYHLREDGYGDFAWDLVRMDHLGKRFQNLGSGNQDYLVWDSPVYLPTAGTVVEVVRDQPDNQPGSFSPNAKNNLIGIHLNGAYVLYLLHFREGSIPPEVQVGAHLEAGDYLGRVGNSGVSLEPHLHMTLLWWSQESSPPRFWSVPSEFKNLYMQQRLDATSVLHEFVDPPAGSWISSSPF